jgi:hypothetical protein
MKVIPKTLPECNQSDIYVLICLIASANMLIYCLVDSAISILYGHQCSPLGADLFRTNIINDPSCPCGCPLEDVIHYLLERPLDTNAGMELFMNITPYTVISIETLLFGSDNLTDETNLLVFTNVQQYIYHNNRFG